MKYQSRHKNNTGVLASVFMWILLVILLSIGIIGIAKASDDAYLRHIKCYGISGVAKLYDLHEYHTKKLEYFYIKPEDNLLILNEIAEVLQLKTITVEQSRVLYKEECL